MSNKNLNEEQIMELHDLFLKYCLGVKELSSKHKVKIRLPNFQEGLSENMIRLFIKNNEKRNCVCSKIGDLCVIDNEVIDNKPKEKLIKIEVKCFSSTGPTSFGPKEGWDEIYFLDACDFAKNSFKIYKCKLSNDSLMWKNMPINKIKNYNDVCKEGKRPRIQFSLIKSYLKEEMKLVFEGNFNSIINVNNVVKETVINEIKQNEKIESIPINISNKKVSKSTKIAKKELKKELEIEL